VRYLHLILLVGLGLSVAAGCGGKEVIEEYKARWIRLSHEPIEEARVGTEALAEAEVEISEDIEDVRLFLAYRTEPKAYQVVEMKLLEGGKYFTSIPTHKRGTLVSYYIEATGGADLAVRVPAGDEDFSFYYKGTPNRPLLIVHIVLMFIALAMLLLCGYLAVKALKNRRLMAHIPRLGFLGGIVFFISAIPLGMIVAYQTYGTPWTGFPVGTDITDNKSLAILIYWAAATFLFRGSAFKKDPTTDLLSMRSLPYVYLAGAIITVILFLIPH
jgi:hypothetical protein